MVLIGNYIHGVSVIKGSLYSQVYGIGTIVYVCVCR